MLKRILGQPSYMLPLISEIVPVYNSGYNYAQFICEGYTDFIQNFNGKIYIS